MASPPNAQDTIVDENSDPNKQVPQRRASKKHKFKPFSAVRKLFSGSKAKRSKTLASPEENDDEEIHRAASSSSGGLRSARPTSAPVQRHAPAGGEERVLRQASEGENRTVSDNSIISPEGKRNTSRTSDPNLPKSAFQAELATKLSNRRSFTGGEDHNTGDASRDSHGVSTTTPTITTTHVDGDEGAGKEDLFHSQWSSAVIGSPSSWTSDISAASKGVPASLDLGGMGRTELLRSDAAKDRISVKPRARKPHGHSRKKKDVRYSLSLPSLVEVESDKSASNISSGGPSFYQPSGRPRSEYIDPSVLSDFDLHVIPAAVSAVELSAPEEKKNEEAPATSTTATTTTASTPPALITTSETPTPTITTVINISTLATPSSTSTLTTSVRSENQAQDSKSSTSQGQVQSDTASPPSSSENTRNQRVSFVNDKVEDVENAPATKAVVVQNDQTLQGSKGTAQGIQGNQGSPQSIQATVQGIQGNQGSPQSIQATVQGIQEDKKEKETAKFINTTESISVVMSVKTGSSSESQDKPSSMSIITTTTTTATTPSAGKKEGLRQTDGESEDAFSPKPDYKLRRQQRSKTLPAQQTVITVQRTASQRGGDKPLGSSGQVTNKNRWEKKEEPVSKSEEPEWVALARRKSKKHSEEAQKLESPGSVVVESAKRSVESSSQIVTSTTTATAGNVAASTRSQPTSSSLSSSSMSSLSSNVAASSSSSSSSTSASTATSVNRQPKSSSQPTEVRSWKTQSLKTSPMNKNIASSSSSSSSSSSATKTTLTPIESSSTPQSTSRSSTSSKTDAKALTFVQPISPTQKSPPLHSKSANSAAAWRTDSAPRSMDPGDVKIELIEKSPSVGTAKVTSVHNKKTPAEAGTRQQDVNKAGADRRDVPADQCRTSVPGRRNSKIMDLLKNFENMQSVS